MASARAEPPRTEDGERPAQGERRGGARFRRAVERKQSGPAGSEQGRRVEVALPAQQAPVQAGAVGTVAVAGGEPSDHLSGRHGGADREGALHR